MQQQDLVNTLRTKIVKLEALLEEAQGEVDALRDPSIDLEDEQ